MSKCRIQYFRLPVPVIYSATKQILLNVFVRFIIGQTHKEISILFCLAHSGRCEFNVLVQEHQPELMNLLIVPFTSDSLFFFNIIV